MPIAKHSTFIQKLRTEADVKNLLPVIDQYFTILSVDLLPNLDIILHELRGNAETTQKFQNCLCTILDEGNYSADTLHELEHAYTATHGDVTVPNRKPIAKIARRARKILDAIAEMLEAMSSLEQQKEFSP